MQKVEPNQQPSRGDGVKKEEPGYWGSTGMRVKGEQEDIKPQIRAGVQTGGWGQHSQPPPPQHHQQPTSSTFDAIAAADAARFAKMQPGAGSHRRHQPGLPAGHKGVPGTVVLLAVAVGGIKANALVTLLSSRLAK